MTAARGLCLANVGRKRKRAAVGNAGSTGPGCRGLTIRPASQSEPIKSLPCHGRSQGKEPLPCSWMRLDLGPLNPTSVGAAQPLQSSDSAQRTAVSTDLIASPSISPVTATTSPASFLTLS